ncbi:MAG TPA: sulfite exporter TauE/SafE family protein [Longimicrobiales bacterium]
MTAAALLALIVVGFAVGFLAGLVGIGGGVLIVPFLYFFYGHSDWSGVSMPEVLHAPVAHATSLLIIVPTAVAGTVTYARSHLVAWRVVLPIALFSMVLAALAATIATRLPPELLKVAFGTFLLLTAAQLLTTPASRTTGPQRSGLLLAAVTGAAVGVFSALLGVGGGLVAIPLLIYVLRLDIRFVAATSLAIVAFAATAGTLTYMLTGARIAGLPAGHVGYVHVYAALPMLPGAILAARWGAKLNQRLGAKRLRWVFALLFAVLGADLIIRHVGLLLER